MTPIDDQPSFVYVTCQVGAEPAVKREVSLTAPQWRLAYSRPGFLTFKLPADCRVTDALGLKSVFARAYGLCLGSARAASVDELAREFWQIADASQYQSLHVWPRDLAAPGHRGFEPGLNDASRAARQALIATAPHETTIEFEREARRGDRVLDCILVEPDLWWIGAHRAARRVRCWPGGIWPGEPPGDTVSRAYSKMSEALAWSGLPIKAGQRCVEIGCAPGGASQALLDHGLRVTGVDPAAVDPAVLARRDFVHIRKRASDLKKKDYAPYQWLAADMNVAPAYTLACVRDIVTHRAVNIGGVIMNLKLLDWRMAEELPAYLAEIRSWGYRRIRARQLSFQRQEVCITGVKSKPLRSRAARRHAAKSARLPKAYPTLDTG